MKTMIKTLAAGLALSTAVVAVPAAAQVSSLGVANLDAAVQRSTAWTTALSQMQTTYKATIDQLNSREAAIRTELQPLVTKLQTDAKAANPNQQALQQQYATLQQRQNAAQQELAKIGQPVARARAYVEEQIAAKLDDALRAAMTRKNVSLVVRPEAALSYQPAADITADVTTELNRLVPSVSITPPANWQPGGQQAAAPATPAAQPAQQQKQPQGR
ncbi:OmpH family outer membrane protein [Sphingomonas sp.]|uniref:OmpH family outer membrane protein n=1 Tax=Sphingomonas sp. TaxID=28214 RepID=UPI002DB68AE7|nr:OmpH family outer membrane protein [Sphingomonas sp.]HEU4967741.1 OmpH family outer membrane protein [Sphingomonas sp.]